MKSGTVLVFGAFDPLHEGHKDFFRQAKDLGSRLLVVVARDASIRSHKGREPHTDEETRMAAVAAVPTVDEVVLGNEQANRYELLSQLDYDILALGYDQVPSDEVVRAELDKRGKHSVPLVRLAPYMPEKYKSTLLRGG
jgi:cytidyltransferase-like protein